MRNSPARGQSDVEDARGCSASCGRHSRGCERHVVLEAREVDPQHHHADGHRDAAREARAGGAERVVRAPAGDEDRRQDDVQRPRSASAPPSSASRCPVPRSAEPSATSANCSASPGVYAVEVGDAGGGRGRIGGHRAQVGAAEEKPASQRQHATDRRQQHRLVEDEIGSRLVLATDGVRDQRHRADAEHLRQREDHEGRRCRRCSPRRSPHRRGARRSTGRPESTASETACRWRSVRTAR